MRMMLRVVVLMTVVVVLLIGLVILTAMQGPVVVRLMRMLRFRPRDTTVRRFEQSEFRGRHTRTQHPLRREGTVVDGEAAQRITKRVERKAEIQQRAEDHVPRRARETIEIQRLPQPYRLPFSR
jgi:hypothetical protein